MLAAINTALLHILPHHALTWVMRRLTRIRITWLKDPVIRTFIRIFAVDMEAAAEPDPTRYAHFDAFFTRALKDSARPISAAVDTAICPVDGHVSEAGSIEHGRLIQAKGIDYSLATLLGGSRELAREFVGGTFATLYLSPRDYHRIHMPVAGRLREMHYVPGRLFSVSPHSTAHVRGLFTRNERLVTVFETEHGPLALVLVGAMFVSGIETVWAGMVSNGRQGPVASAWDYGDHEPPIALDRGQEMGCFHMGSTVIAIFPAGVSTLDDAIRPGNPIRMGQPLGRLSS